MTYLEEKEQVNAWLHDRGIQHGLAEIYDNPILCHRYAADLLELLRSPFSFNMLAVIAGAFRTGEPTRSQQREACGILLTTLKQNAGKDDIWYSSLAMKLAELVDESAVHELGQMLLDKHFGEVRHSFTFGLLRIGNADAISYLLQGAKDPEVAASALEALARLHVKEALPLCEAALNKPDFSHKAHIKKTYGKIKRLLARNQCAANHLTQDSFPKGLAEWSANLDGSGLSKVLRAIEKCVQSGFGQQEMNEIKTTAEGLSVDQAARLKFEVKYEDRQTALWLELFCDDDAAYDVDIAGPKELITKLAFLLK